MLKKNNIWLGIFLGIIFPGLAFLCTEIFKKNLRMLGKDDLFYIVSVVLNLFMLRYYFRSDKGNTAFGILLSTFIGAFIFFFFKSRQ